MSVEDGVVSLLGHVGDLRSKRAATDDASNTRGVRGVHNLLGVRSDRDWLDTELQKRVTAALKRSPYTDRRDITVDVLNARVWIYGKVDTGFEKARAEDVVAAVGGIAAIENRLEVADSGASFADGEIRDAVRRRLRWSPYVDPDHVTVRVENDVVTLTGAVHGWRALLAAERCAHRAGAQHVENELTVGDDDG